LQQLETQLQQLKSQLQQQLYSTGASFRGAAAIDHKHRLAAGRHEVPFCSLGDLVVSLLPSAGVQVLVVVVTYLRCRPSAGVQVLQWL